MTLEDDAQLKRAVDELHNLVQVNTERWQHDQRPTKWLSRNVGYVLTILTIFISAATIFFSLRSINGVLSDAAGNVIGPLTLNGQNIALASAQISSVTASTYRENYQNSTVAFPQNVIDGNPATAWSECKGGKDILHESRRLGGTFKEESTGTGGCPSSGVESTREGAGEWLQLNLTQAVNLKAFRIRNGYEKSNSLFFRNPRVHDLQVSVNGNPVEGFIPTSSLGDYFGYQTISFGQPMLVSTIRFTILSVYPAEAFPARFNNNYDPNDRNHRPFSDTSLSDIQLIPLHRGQ